MTAIIIISSIAFFIVILLCTAVLLMYEEQTLVSDARAEIFDPAAASAHSAQLILDKMLKTKDADSFDDGVRKFNSTTALLRAAAVRLVGLQRNHTTS